MRVRTLLISLVALVCLFTLAGCGKSESNTIVGKWALSNFVYTFNEDGTCSYDAAGTLMKCTYETDGDKLSILYDGDTVSFDTTYSIDGNKLNVRDSFGNDTIYTRK